MSGKPDQTITDLTEKKDRLAVELARKKWHNLSDATFKPVNPKPGVTWLVGLFSNTMDFA